MTGEVDPRWYETFFEADWLKIARTRPEKRTEQEVAFVAERLGLSPGDRVLDLACGHCRSTSSTSGPAGSARAGR